MLKSREREVLRVAERKLKFRHFLGDEGARCSMLESRVYIKTFGLPSTTSGDERSHRPQCLDTAVCGVLIPPVRPATRHVAFRNAHRINLPRVSDQKIAPSPQQSPQQWDVGSAVSPRLIPSRHQSGRPSFSIRVTARASLIQPFADYRRIFSQDTIIHT